MASKQKKAGTIFRKKQKIIPEQKIRNWTDMETEEFCRVPRGIVGLPLDRYVPPESFREPRFYRTFLLQNRFSRNEIPVLPEEFTPPFSCKPIFTLILAILIPGFREFLGEKPARTGGTSLNDHIG